MRTASRYRASVSGGETHFLRDGEVYRDTGRNHAALFGSFEDIWIVDMRYCDTSAIQLAKDNGITDLLFCSCTFSATAQNQYKLKEIM